MALKPHFKKISLQINVKLSIWSWAWKGNLHGKETSIGELQKMDAQAWE